MIHDLVVGLSKMKLFTKFGVEHDGGEGTSFHTIKAASRLQISAIRMMYSIAPCFRQRRANLNGVNLIGITNLEDFAASEKYLA